MSFKTNEENGVSFYMDLMIIFTCLWKNGLIVKKWPFKTRPPKVVLPKVEIMTDLFHCAVQKVYICCSFEDHSCDLHANNGVNY